jgi:ribulose-phosphate 3-epimerase
MISAPDLFLDEFVEAGADSFLVHWECNANLHRTVQRIKTLGKRAGVVINPATPAAVLEEILPLVDQVLVMTVDPGFGHQQFLETTLPKIRRVREMIERLKPGCDLEVDGGIDVTTARLAVEAGANILLPDRPFSETAAVSLWAWSVCERAFIWWSTRVLTRSSVCNWEWLVLEEWAPIWCGAC